MLNNWSVITLLVYLLAQAIAGWPLPPVRVASDSPVKILAAYVDTLETGVQERAEAVRLINLDDAAVSLAGWRLSDGEGSAQFPAGAAIGPGQRLWVARDAQRFLDEFGQSPDWRYGSGSAAIPALAVAGQPPRFDNAGDEVLLLDAGQAVAEALVYGQGNTAQAGWSGAALQPYRFGTNVPLDGQILTRRPDEATGVPLPDTNTAADWAQSLVDPISARQVFYPGWGGDRLANPAQAQETATTQFLLAPDNAYEAIRAALAGAQTEIRIAAYTFDHPGLVEVLRARRAAGVAVTLLLDGAVVGASGGLTNGTRWAAQQLAQAGATIDILRDGQDAGGVPVPRRYQTAHRKFILIDGKQAIVSSENFSPDALPADSKLDGTRGNRGAAIITDASSVVARLDLIWRLDADSSRFHDVTAFNPATDGPPSGYRPAPTANEFGYQPIKPRPRVVSANQSFELLTAPDSTMRQGDSLLGLVARAGAGDLVLVEQLYELPWDGYPDPLSPRLQAYLDAARRGATVLILLDATLDFDGANRHTVEYLNTVATNEGLKLEAQRGQPTLAPIHDKLVLVRAGAAGWVHVGSLNGSETSAKLNREVALQVGSLEGLRYYAEVFARDWRAVGGRRFFDQAGPLVTDLAVQPNLGRGPLLVSATLDDGTTGDLTVTAAELFVDDDPGTGHGLALAPLAGEDEQPRRTLRGALPTTGLKAGWHTLAVRGQDGAGNWGPAVSRLFYVDRTRKAEALGFLPALTLGAAPASPPAGPS